MNPRSSNPIDLPALPPQCDEIQATVTPGSTARLKNYVDDLPGLTADRFTLLSKIAHTTRGSRDDSTHRGTTVLGLDDVLQKQHNDAVGLHPRITHIVPVRKLDVFHEAVTDIYYDDLRRNGYQYPSHVLEYRGIFVDKTLLYPPEWNKRIADIAGSLRADDILTSIRRPGQSRPEPAEFQRAVDAMEDADEDVTGAVTFYQPESDSEPTVFVHSHNNCIENFSIDDLVDHCIFHFHRHGILLDIVSNGTSL
jgi:hypothetical protein